jgi:hypothetical protein
VCGKTNYHFSYRFDRKKRYKVKDWRVIHNAYIQLWQSRERISVDAGPPHDQHTFDEYLMWLHRSMRTHINPPYTEDAIDEDDKEDVYNIATREETTIESSASEICGKILECYNLLSIWHLLSVLKWSNRISVPRPHNYQGCPTKQRFDFTSLEGRGQAF